MWVRCLVPLIHKKFLQEPIPYRHINNTISSLASFLPNFLPSSSTAPTPTPTPLTAMDAWLSQADSTLSIHEQSPVLLAPSPFPSRFASDYVDRTPQYYLEHQQHASDRPRRGTALADLETRLRTYGRTNVDVVNEYKEMLLDDGDAVDERDLEFEQKQEHERQYGEEAVRARDSFFSADIGDDGVLPDVVSQDQEEYIEYAELEDSLFGDQEMGGSDSSSSARPGDDRLIYNPPSSPPGESDISAYSPRQKEDQNHQNSGLSYNGYMILGNSQTPRDTALHHIEEQRLMVRRFILSLSVFFFFFAISRASWFLFIYLFFLLIFWSCFVFF